MEVCNTPKAEWSLSCPAFIWQATVVIVAELKSIITQVSMEGTDIPEFFLTEALTDSLIDPSMATWS